MARKTILTLVLAGATLAAVPVLAQTAPPAPDCAADPAACQAIVDRVGPGAARDNEDRRMGDRDGKREGRRGHDERGRHGDREGPRGGDDQRGPWQAGMMQRFDGNGDGMVSADEASAGITGLMTQFDTNADQALTVEEFTALHAELMKPMAARAFGMLDTNADGRIDATEAQAVAQRMGRKAPPPPPAPPAAAAPAPAEGGAPAAPAPTPTPAPAPGN